MTHKQRLVYSLILIAVVLASMLGLSWAASQGLITDAQFRTCGILIAISAVIANAVMRRKVRKP